MHAELLCPSPVSGQPPPILQPLSCNLQLASCIVHGPSSIVRSQPSILPLFQPSIPPLLSKLQAHLAKLGLDDPGGKLV